MLEGFLEAIMSIGFSLATTVKKQRFFERTPKIAETLTAVEQAVNEQIGDPLLKKYLQINRDEHDILVTVHPAGVELRFHMDTPGEMLCEAQTNPCGPGYHAFLIELVDAIGAQCKLSWREENDGDVTGYWQERDFVKLQGEMMSHLRAMAQFVSSQQTDKFRISLPVDFGPAGEYFAASPLGFWTSEWFQEILQADDAAQSLAATFFPWWDKGMTATTWRNFGLTMAWCELPWHPPCNTAERQAFQRTLDSFSRARELQPDIQLPEQEIAEIQELLRWTGIVTTPPVPTGIGFRRGLMCTMLPGEWTIDIPGFFLTQYDEANGTTVFYFDDKTIRINTYMVNGNDDQPISREDALHFAEEQCEKNMQRHGVAIEERILEHHRHLSRMANLYKAEEKGRKYYWSLGGWHVTTGHLCLTTLSFDNIADKEWALRTWRSIMHPPE